MKKKKELWSHHSLWNDEKKKIKKCRGLPFIGKKWKFNLEEPEVEDGRCQRGAILPLYEKAESFTQDTRFGYNRGDGMPGGGKKILFVAGGRK